MEMMEIKLEPPSSPTTTTMASNISREPAPVETKALKPVKTTIRIKKTDVRQCRLCLRVLSKDTVKLIGTVDIRRKIVETVGVWINESDEVKSVCTHCLLVVDMIDEFRATCRKADLLHSTKLMMMHPGSWLSEENRNMLEGCQKLLKRNRAEMDGLFKCSGVQEGQVPKKKRKKVVLEEAKVTTEVKMEKMSESEEGTSSQCEVKVRLRYPQAKIMCDICGKLIRKCTLEYHLNRHVGLKPYQCTEEGCEATFCGTVALGQHIIAVHQKDEQRYECKICHRMLKGWVGLRTHMNSQHNKDKHPLKTECTICGKMYYKNFIKDHMAMHMGDFPYECEFCDRKFAAKNNWLFHRKKYHEDELNAQFSSENTSAPGYGEVQI